MTATEKLAPSFTTPEQREGFARVTDFFDSLDDQGTQWFLALVEVVQELKRGNQDAAGKAAEALVRGLPDDEDGSGLSVVRTIAETLLGRIVHVSSSGGNLYLDARPPGAQLRAFELLRLRTPLIPFGYTAANRALLDVVDFGTKSLTLIDVGIGRGGQIRALLKHPRTKQSIARIHVVGIEPDSREAGGGALELAQTTLRETAAEVGIAFSFTGIGKRAEAVTVEDLRGAGVTFAGPKHKTVANASLSLHHVADDEGSGRHRVLSTLFDAGVEHMVLLEPDSDHHTDDLLIRLAFVFRHYVTLLRSLLASLPSSDANLVWSEFFAPEVRNIMGHEGEMRTERHQETSTWAEHLEATGFVVDALNDLVPQAAAPAGFFVGQRNRGFNLRYGNTSLLSVLRGTRPAPL